ncbi:MAG: hypothetical protein QOI74_1542 [Micromonosporaceae bacterium]|nr:hypothetical protein [Micromonosporaceae bacterium]
MHVCPTPGQSSAWVRRNRPVRTDDQASDAARHGTVSFHDPRAAEGRVVCYLTPAYECRPETTRLIANRLIIIVAQPTTAIQVATVRFTLGVARACR